ncbi:nucleotide exchange factor GrpE [Albibacterium bauzanense]|uniref:Protein GrpE n=1 Tax=Albibacterium bauzanense TaxID=653929 RepID=A0A4R1M2B3_9SPHI|nr:nucleotide exchange factor GrpE [Albibacterium bauzanense]TCK84984.1 molecular chaperone GrpE [Albibacterium bauzanense]
MKNKHPEGHLENTNPEEHLENKKIIDELESVNEARLHSKDDSHLNEADQADDLSPEILLKAELKEANDKYLRLYAEFDNYKRRTSKERIELLQTAGKEVIGDLLSTLDDFDRALKAMELSDSVDSIKEGVTLVSQKLKKTLQQKGLKEMESINQPFDAEIHEAITNIPAPTDDLKGKVLDEIEKGYYLNDKVLRYAKVVVGS